MDRELFLLAWQGLKRKRKNSLLLFFVLALSFAFAVITLSVSGSMIRTNREYRLDTYGQWKFSLTGTEENLERLAAEPDLYTRTGSSFSVGEIRTPSGSSGIGTVDEDFRQIGRLGLQDGRFPETAEEIAVEAHTLSMMNCDYTLGQVISAPVSISTSLPGESVTVSRDFTLCGVIREYTNLWEAPAAGSPLRLNSAVITPEGGRALRLLAEERAAEIREAAKEEVKNAEERGEKPNGHLLALCELRPEEPEAPLLIAESQRTLEELKARLPEALPDTEEDDSGGLPRYLLNASAYSENQDDDVQTIYIWAIFAVTLLAVLCINAIQLQKQVRQIALFRSVGITKRQLREKLLVETALLVVPAAAAGAALGAAGTWAALRLLVYSGSLTVRVAVPWQYLLPLLLLWLAGVFLAWAAVQQIALREPLTGRVAMKSGKARRYRAARKLLVAVLSVLLCAAVIFTAALSVRDYFEFYQEKILPSYSVSALGDYGGRGAVVLRMIPEAAVAEISGAPCVLRVDAIGTMSDRYDFSMRPSMIFEGMEQVELARYTMESQTPAGEEPDYSLGVVSALQLVRDAEHMCRILGGTPPGLDKEAFDRGETVVVSFGLESDGTYTALPFTGRRFTEHGVRPGDTVTLRVKGRLGNSPDAVETALELSVGAVAEWQLYDDEYYNMLGAMNSPYVVWCSKAFAGALLSSLEPGMKLGCYSAGQEEGSPVEYTDAEAFTDLNASYFTTDSVAAKICKDYGIQLFNFREENSARARERAQTLLLVLAGGSCVVLVALLLLGDILAVETEHEKKRCGILQALGMSPRTIRLRLVGRAVLYGAAGALAGWCTVGVYLLREGRRILQEWLEDELLYGIDERLTTLDRAILTAVDGFRRAGWNAGTALLLTAGTVALIAAVFLLAKRGLFRRDLMENLREEQ